MTSALNPADVLLLEQGQLRTPLESLRKLQKQTQKVYDYNLGAGSAFQRDLGSFAATCATVPEGAPLDDAQKGDMLKSVDSMLSKMRGLKRKLSDLRDQSTAATSVAQARMDRLNALPSSMESPAYEPWARKRLSFQLADHFLRSNPPLKLSAASLAKEEGIEALVDWGLWDELDRAERGLKERRVEEVLAWVSDNKAALKKMKTPLEFMIHLQAYIELCRERKLVEAIAYAKKCLAPAAAQDEAKDGTAMKDLQKAMGLLGFPPDTTCSVYSELYSTTRWDSLLALFRTTFFALHYLPPVPLLHLSLQAGLASLKTPICCPLPANTTSPDLAHGATEGKRSPHCPVCSSSLGVLAKEVPYSHHELSTIVCGISGKVVEGGDGSGGELLALVNKVTNEGHVYSKEAIMAAAAHHPEGKIVEPQTGEVFEVSDTRKVFIT